MSFPIYDRFGQIDPVQRKLHLEQSVTPESLIEHTKGKTLEELRFEDNRANPINLIPSEELGNQLGIGFPEGEISESEQGLGPKGHRYIQDPSDPGSVIDMRHFIEASRIGFFGEYLGAGVEVQQGLYGYDSAWEQEDFKSNFLGVVFRNNYYDPNRDISEQFEQFFTDLKNDDLKGFIPRVSARKMNL